MNIEYIINLNDKFEVEIMLKYLFQGFLLGLSYVAPIGMQNLYVINSAISKKFSRAILTAFITIFFDISLALVCFFGVGTMLQKSVIFKLAVLLFGSIIVIYIGIKLIISKIGSSAAAHTDDSIVKVILSCFTVTWINPQAIIDGSLLLGGFRISLPVAASNFFIFGSCLASFTWFTSLTVVTACFKQVINDKVIRVINIVCGIIITYYGVRLGVSFIKLTAGR